MLEWAKRAQRPGKRAESFALDVGNVCTRFKEGGCKSLVCLMSLENWLGDHESRIQTIHHRCIIQQVVYVVVVGHRGTSQKVSDKASDRVPSIYPSLFALLHLRHNSGE